MEITEVKIRRIFTNEPHLRAIVSVVIDDCLAVHDIKLIEGQKGFFLAMPNRKTAAGKFLDVVHPMNSEIRQRFFEAIYAAYLKELAEAQAIDEVAAGSQ